MNNTSTAVGGISFRVITLIFVENSLVQNKKFAYYECQNKKVNKIMR